MKDWGELIAHNPIVFVPLLFLANRESFTEETREEYQHKLPGHARDVFWHIYREQEGSEQVSSRIEESVLTKLSEAEAANRIAYEPDTEAPSDSLNTYIHVAAAKAILLKRRDNTYSDDVRQTLVDSFRALNWFGSVLLDGWSLPTVQSYLWDYGENNDLLLFQSKFSIAAVTSLIFVEMFQLNRIDRNYAEAFHLCAQGLGIGGEIVCVSIGVSWSPGAMFSACNPGRQWLFGKVDQSGGFLRSQWDEFPPNRVICGDPDPIVTIWTKDECNSE